MNRYRHTVYTPRGGETTDKITAAMDAFHKRTKAILDAMDADVTLELTQQYKKVVDDDRPSWARLAEAAMGTRDDPIAEQYVIAKVLCRTWHVLATDGRDKFIRRRDAVLKRTITSIKQKAHLLHGDMNVKTTYRWRRDKNGC